MFLIVRFLTRANLSDSELKRNKNLQHIRRTINKGVLTTTRSDKKVSFIFFKIQTILLV
jgi:hypothetical protein